MGKVYSHPEAWTGQTGSIRDKRQMKTSGVAGQIGSLDLYFPRGPRERGPLQMFVCSLYCFTQS